MLWSALVAVFAYVPWNEDEDYTTSTLAGGDLSGRANGVGTNATFNQPTSVAIDTLTQLLYISDRGNHMVRVLDVNSTVVETLVGSTAGYADGVGTAGPGCKELVDTNSGPVATAMSHRMSQLTDLPSQSLDFLQQLRQVVIRVRVREGA